MTAPAVEIRKINAEEVMCNCAKHRINGFVRYTYGQYKMGWVQEDICARLDAFLTDTIAGKSPRLMICMPPRHGKSELASRRFPAYALGRYPHLSIIAASYSSALASRNNRDVQRIMDSAEYARVFPNVKLPTPKDKGLSRTADLFEIVDHGGSYRSAGVGVGITGMGADILIIDDPIKDRADADSATIRERVWDWYTSTAYSRLSAGAGVLLINTRWHLGDLSGRLLEAAKSGDGDMWDVVEYPAIATAEEAHRHIGEALHPERFSLEALTRIKSVIGTRDWEALYQQRPTVEGGAVFKRDWIRFYSPEQLPSKFDEVLTSWDMTFKDSAGGDFVSGQVWAKAGADFYLLDLVHRQIDFVQTLDAFCELAAKYPQAKKHLVEDKANGPAVISALKAHISGIIPVEPDGSKTARAYAVTPFFEAGNVHIPVPGSKPWVQEYLDELCNFPTAAHDDNVDAMTQALRTFAQIRPAMKINPRNIRRNNLPFRR